MSEMEQVRQQDRAQVHDPATGRFLPGRSGNPAGTMPRAERERRVLAKARALSRELGGWSRMGVLDREYLLQAARLLLCKPRHHDDRVRLANSVRRLLVTVEGRRGRREASGADEFTRLLLPEEVGR
ncbi:MAG TPA: hypothetical protein VF913_21660 [Xanthobacteraceae bacterium]